MRHTASYMARESEWKQNVSVNILEKQEFNMETGAIEGEWFTFFPFTTVLFTSWVSEGAPGQCHTSTTLPTQYHPTSNDYNILHVLESSTLYVQLNDLNQTAGTLQGEERTVDILLETGAYSWMKTPKAAVSTVRLAMAPFSLFNFLCGETRQEIMAQNCRRLNNLQCISSNGSVACICTPHSTLEEEKI